MKRVRDDKLGGVPRRDRKKERFLTRQGGFGMTTLRRGRRDSTGQSGDWRSQEELLVGDGGLDLFLVHVEISVHVLDVVVILERFHQAEHLLGLLAT
jgi:hypothetical protein